MFQVNQKVWCAIYGAGVVAGIRQEGAAYPVVVKFNVGRTVAYTRDGKYGAEGNITLFPYPVEIVRAKVKPSIDWSHVSEDYQYLAMDESGLHHLFAEEPIPDSDEWTTSDLYIYANHFASFKAGTCHWRDSLVKRPN